MSAHFDAVPTFGGLSEPRASASLHDPTRRDIGVDESLCFPRLRLRSTNEFQRSGRPACSDHLVSGIRLAERASKQPAIASRMLSRASTSVRPCETHPWIAGHSATIIPFSSGSSVTSSFILKSYTGWRSAANTGAIANSLRKIDQNDIGVFPNAVEYDLFPVWRDIEGHRLGVPQAGELPGVL